MSDFLAEARVIIRPDTTQFRAQLLTAVTAAARGVTVPVNIVAAGTTAGITGALAADMAAGARATKVLSEEEKRLRAEERELEKAQRDRMKTQRQLSSATIAAGAGMTGLRGAVLTAGGAFIAATVAIQGFGRAVQSAAQLETNLNVFRVTAGATADEMERVGETAKDLGRDLTLPGVTASDAAETFLTLSRAGLSVQDSLAGARGTLQLAVAAQISFADAAQLTASALNAFGLSGDSAVAVADTLTNAANASQASISDMGIALRQSAAIADLAGFSFGETSTFLTQLAQAGLSGSDAGTSFRVAIQRLIAPTGAARDALESLNINLRDAQGNLRPEAFFELGEALERMGRAQGDATRQLIFGNDASRAAAFFARINAKAFREQEEALNKAGAAAEVAGARNEGFAGSVENLKNQVTALGIEIGESSIPLLGIAADGAALFFGALATQMGETRKVFGDISEDVKEFGGALRTSLDDSGFTQFANDVAEGGRLINQDLENAGDAIGGFVGGLAGIEGSAEAATVEIKGLSDEEARLAEAITDVHDRIDIQTGDLERVATAAQQAAGAIGRLTGQIAGLEEGVTRARIAGDEGAELDLLNQERERLQRLLRIEESIVAEGGKGAATARERIRNQILPQLESVSNEINAIIGQQASDAKAAADDAERARDERDRNIIDAIGGEEARRRNAVIAAQATATLQDDISTQVNLRNFYKRSIEEVRRTVRDAKLAAQIIAGLIADQISADQEIQRSREELKQQRQDERREARERLRESLALDVQIAQATGNEGAEASAREREIAQIKLEIRQTREGSNQRKRLILELRQKQKELRELREVEADTAKSDKQTAQQFFFSQLQAQQGFAANLMGNLITGPTDGLVGVPSDNLAGGIRRESAAAEGRAALGPTSGQTNTEIDVLRRILSELRRLNGSYDSPEAITQKKSSQAIMDGIGGV